jgi:hypothetical protein
MRTTLRSFALSIVKASAVIVCLGVLDTACIFAVRDHDHDRHDRDDDRREHREEHREDRR